MKTINNLCADVGYLSLNHVGEQLCGDHVEVADTPGDSSTVIVLADGLGSGVKANILSILTSKIISTMLSAGMSLDESVKTVAETLPVCKTRGVAYSTSRSTHTQQPQSEIIQYDNPKPSSCAGKSLELPFMR